VDQEYEKNNEYRQLLIHSEISPDKARTNALRAEKQKGVI